MFDFKILKKSGRARTAEFVTPHGVIETPHFVPVATKATVKTLSGKDVEKIGFGAVLANTYHLMLQPGADLVKKFGGLHKFMDWGGPIFTDSGGYQVFSLGKGLEQGVGKVTKARKQENKKTRKQESNKTIKQESKKAKDKRQETGDKGQKTQKHENKKSLIKITDDGVEFRSHIDGRKIFLRPKDSIKIQEKLGADIIFAFDECTSPEDGREYMELALERTHRWAKESLEAKKRTDQALFGIVQGGEYKRLREASATFIGSLDFEGFGIGGSFGKDEMKKVLDLSLPLLPEVKPRHMLGIGTVEDIFIAVERGIDTFDCVEPTRLGRHGTLLTFSGKIRILSGRYRADKKPVEKNCPCELCQNYTRGYLHHLFRAGEILGMRLATEHNLTFMKRLMDDIRHAIKNGKLAELRKKILKY